MGWVSVSLLSLVTCLVSCLSALFLVLSTETDQTLSRWTPVHQLETRIAAAIVPEDACCLERSVRTADLAGKAQLVNDSAGQGQLTETKVA